MPKYNVLYKYACNAIVFCYYAVLEMPSTVPISKRVILAAFAFMLVATVGGVLYDSICDEISIGPEIGNGSYGVVRSADYKDVIRSVFQDPKFAVKQFNIEDSTEDYFREYETLQSLEEAFVARNPNPRIVRHYPLVFGICEVKSLTPFIITDFIRSNIIAENRYIYMEVILIHSLCEAVSQIHQLGFVHLDLKPENVRVDADNVVRLIDFGTSEQLFTATGGSKITRGTPYYMAPEVMRIDWIPHMAKNKVDVWGVGMVVYEILTHRKAIHDGKCVEKVQVCIKSSSNGYKYIETERYIKALYILTKAALPLPILEPTIPDDTKILHFEKKLKEDKVASKCAKKCKSKTLQTSDFQKYVQERIKNEGQYKEGEEDKIITKMISFVFHSLLCFDPQKRKTINKVLVESYNLETIVRNAAFG